MAMPRFDIPRMDSSSASASFSVRTAVGSSRISSLSCSLESSLAISVNCLCPTGMSLMTIFRSMLTPIISIAFAARSSISVLSSVFSRSPNISEMMLYFLGSLLRRMFSVVVNPGIRENSWCTMPMPAAIASKGELNLTTDPLSRISPPYPPVSRIISAPKRILISVDFPAPFSPTSPMTSPSPTDRLISVRTWFPKKFFLIFSISRSGLLSLSM